MLYKFHQKLHDDIQFSQLLHVSIEFIIFIILSFESVHTAKIFTESLSQMTENQLIQFFELKIPSHFTFSDLIFCVPCLTKLLFKKL